MCICATLFSSRSSSSSSSLSSSGGNCWIFDLLRFDSYYEIFFFFFNSSSCQIPLTKKTRSSSSCRRIKAVKVIGVPRQWRRLRPRWRWSRGVPRLSVRVFVWRFSSRFFSLFSTEGDIRFLSVDDDDDVETMMMMMMMSNRQTSVFPRRTPCPQNADSRDVPSSFLCLF